MKTKTMFLSLMIAFFGMAINLFGQSVPTINTDSSGTVGPTYAFFYGSYTNDDSTFMQTWFKYGISPSALSDSTPVVSQTAPGSGSASAMVLGLQSNTTYYFRCCGENSLGSTQGITKSFVTSGFISIPAITITGGSSSVTQTSGTIFGSYESNSAVACKFMWGYSSTYLNHETAVVNHSIGSGTDTVELTGLAANTIIYYQYFSSNSASEVSGVIKSFTTQSHIPAIMTTGLADNISQTMATIYGSYQSETAISTKFKWWTNDVNKFESVSVSHGAGSGNETYDLTDLSPQTTYYYQIFGNNSAGETPASVKTFTTLAYTPPTVVTEEASLITQNTATISGSYNSETAISTKFKWGLSVSNLSNTTTAVSQSVGSGTVNYNLTNLSANTTYYYQFIGANSASSNGGEVLSFTTLAWEQATASIVMGTITDETVSLSVVYDGNGSEVTSIKVKYWQLGSTNYQFTPSVSPSNEYGTKNFTLANLTPDKDYVCLALVTNSAGQMTSDEFSFATELTVLSTNAIILSVFSSGSKNAEVSFVYNSNDPLSIFWVEYSSNQDLSNGFSSPSINLGVGENIQQKIEVDKITAGGKYYFTVVYLNSSFVTRSTDTISFLAPTGITEINGDENGVKVFPNPVDQEFILDSPESGNLILTDLAGRIILQKSFDNGLNKFRREELSSGVYFIQLFNSDSVEFSRGKIVFK